MALISAPQRKYLAAHPIALWLSLAIAVSGAIQLVRPELVASSPVALALPEWLRLIFASVYLIAGLACVFGLVRGRPKWEAAGDALVASVLVVQFAAALHLFGTDVIGTALVTALLGVGFAQRSIHLARGGY